MLLVLELAILVDWVLLGLLGLLLMLVLVLELWRLMDFQLLKPVSWLQVLSLKMRLRDLVHRHLGLGLDIACVAARLLNVGLGLLDEGANSPGQMCAIAAHLLRQLFESTRHFVGGL